MKARRQLDLVTSLRISAPEGRMPHFAHVLFAFEKASSGWKTTRTPSSAARTARWRSLFLKQFAGDSRAKGLAQAARVQEQEPAGLLGHRVKGQHAIRLPRALPSARLQPRDVREQLLHRAYRQL